jgi:cytochrome c553
MTRWSVGLLIRLVTVLATVALGLQVAQAEAHSEPGERIRTVCASCHGPSGQSIAPEIPNLAGQAANYLAGQLTAFKSGQRKSAVMGPMAMPLTEDDIRGLAAYYEAQPRFVGSADPKLVESGGRLYRGGNHDNGLPACMACHGPSGVGNPAAGFPAISGQHAAYTLKQFAAYKAGERSGDRAELMQAIALRLTEAEAAAIAGYLQGLH